MIYVIVLNTNAVMWWTPVQAVCRCVYNRRREIQILTSMTSGPGSIPYSVSRDSFCHSIVFHYLLALFFYLKSKLKLESDTVVSSLKCSYSTWIPASPLVVTKGSEYVLKYVVNGNDLRPYALPMIFTVPFTYGYIV
jgi:hypothetical protein